MFFDMAVITAIGFVLEIFCIKFGGTVFNFPAYSGMSMLIVFVTVTRWGLWGLLSAPFMALGVLLGGANMDFFWYYAKMYDWRVYISVAVSLCAIGLNVILFKKIGTKKMLNEIWKIILLAIVDYIIVCGIQALVYGLTTIGCSEDYLVYTATVGDKTSTYYRRYLGEMCIVYNLFGLAVLIVGSIILRSQGVLCNAKEKLIDDKKNADLDREFEKFTIKECNCEDASGETESQQTDEVKDE